MIKKIIYIIALLLFSVESSYAREQIRAVGSSTVYPFATVIAEEFGRKTSFKTPIIESTGTGGGVKLFCSGIGEQHPDFVNASREMKKSEVELCKKNGVNEVTEIRLGFDGIVLANSSESKQANFTLEQIFLALARKVPSNGKLIDNPYKKWNEISPSLPNDEISIYGPPPTSGTRDSFVELVMQEACNKIKEFKSAYPDDANRNKQCQLIREDGAYIESGENDNLIVQKLKTNLKAFGIFGFSFLEENSEVVQGSKINGVEPDFDNIKSGAYPISRPLHIYFKNAHVKLISGMKEFIQEIISDGTLGNEGYLVLKGLIPLDDEERKIMQDNVKKALGEK